MRGRLSEIFESFQGEGIYAGERQLFVRFFGCNLACKFCDTTQAAYTEYEPHELINELKMYNDDYHSVSFTGGEPLMQMNFLKEAMRLTRHEGFRNYLETNGTMPRELEEVIDLVDFVAMDVKLPSSTGEFPYWKAHRNFLKVASAKETFVKIVVCKSTHIEDIFNALDLIKEVNPWVITVLQPDSNDLSFELDSKIEYYKILCERRALVSCHIPQIHKKIGVR